MVVVYVGLFFIYYRFLFIFFFCFYDVNEWLVDNLGYVVYGVYFFVYFFSIWYESDGVISIFFCVGGLFCGIWFDGFLFDDFDWMVIYIDFFVYLCIWEFMFFL